jgi:hypothetical protein
VTAWSGPLVVATALLGLAGLGKFARPAPTASAMRAMGLPVTPLVVRLAAGVEAVIGFSAAATGRRPLVAAAGLSYLAFAGFVGLAIRRGRPIASCGCFGDPDTPPSWLHAAVDLMAALACFGAMAGDGAAGLRAAASAQPAAGLPFFLLCGVATNLGYLVLTALPRTSRR